MITFLKIELPVTFNVLGFVKVFVLCVKCSRLNKKYEDHADMLVGMHRSHFPFKIAFT